MLDRACGTPLPMSGEYGFESFYRFKEFRMKMFAIVLHAYPQSLEKPVVGFLRACDEQAAWKQLENGGFESPGEGEPPDYLRHLQDGYDSYVDVSLSLMEITEVTSLLELKRRLGPPSKKARRKWRR